MPRGYYMDTTGFESDEVKGRFNKKAEGELPEKAYVFVPTGFGDEGEMGLASRDNPGYFEEVSVDGIYPGAKPTQVTVDVLNYRVLNITKPQAEAIKMRSQGFNSNVSDFEGEDYSEEVKQQADVLQRMSLKKADLDDEISRAWYQLASGVQVGMMDIPKIFRDIRSFVEKGGTVEDGVEAAKRKYGLNNPQGTDFDELNEFEESQPVE